MPDSDATLILGIGNLLWADEGFGIRCVEALAEGWRVPDGVRVMDGGTQGLYLLPYVEAARRLVIFDAVDFGLPAATLRIMRGDEVPQFLGAKKMSLHQTGFQDVLATARLRGWAPEALVLIGCQPVELEDYGGGLRPEVAAQIDPAIAAARAELAGWGLEVAPGRSTAPDLGDPTVRRAAYESGRPSAETAFRRGDERFLGRNS